MGLMKPFSAAELAAMQATQESSMMGTCVILKYTEVENTHGEAVPTWVDGPTLKCGFNPSPSQTGQAEEVRQPDMTVVTVDSVVRLPLETAIDLRDRIKIVLRFGQPPVEQQTFEIVGQPRRGPSALVLKLKRVET